jgi:hypothetical protein
MNIGRFRVLACFSGINQPVYSVRGGLAARTNIDLKAPPRFTSDWSLPTANYRPVKILVLEAWGWNSLARVSGWLNSCYFMLRVAGLGIRCGTT